MSWSWGEDEDATLRDNVYAKIVDQACSADIRSDALAFALDLEEFDSNTSQGDAQRSLRDLGRFVEASVLGDDGPTTLTSLAADAFLALPERASLLRDWRAWVALLQRDDRRRRRAPGEPAISGRAPAVMCAVGGDGFTKCGARVTRSSTGPAHEVRR